VGYDVFSTYTGSLGRIGGVDGIVSLHTWDSGSDSFVHGDEPRRFGLRFGSPTGIDDGVGRTSSVLPSEEGGGGGSIAGVEEGEKW